MTYFPHNPAKRRAISPITAFAPVRQGMIRDVLWGQPLFKAPVLPNPRIALDPLPFTAVRVTQRSDQA